MSSNKIWNKATSTNTSQAGVLKQNGELLIKNRNDDNIFKLSNNEFLIGVKKTDNTQFLVRGDNNSIFVGKTTEDGDVGFAIEDGKPIIKGNLPLRLSSDAVDNSDAVTYKQLKQYFDYSERGTTENQAIDTDANNVVTVEVKCLTDETIQNFFNTWFEINNITGSRNAIFGTAIPLFVSGVSPTDARNIPWSEQIMPSSVAQSITGEYGFIRKLGDNEGLVGYFRRVGAEDVKMDDEKIDPYLNYPLFRDFYCNYVYDINGNRRVTAIKEMNDGKYKESGNVDVGILSPAFWVKVEDVVVPLDSDDEDAETLTKLYPSFKNLSQYCSTYDGVVGIKEKRFWMCYELPESEKNNGWHYWSAGVRHNGEKSPFMVHTPYLSGYVNGKLRSQPGLRVVQNKSYKWLYNYYSDPTSAGYKGKGYHGGGMELWSWAILNMIIKYGCKSSQRLCSGVAGNNESDNSIWYIQNQASTDEKCLIVNKTPTGSSDNGFYPIAGNYVGITKGGTRNNSTYFASSCANVVTINGVKLENVLITRVEEDGSSLKYYFDNLPSGTVFGYDSSSTYAITMSYPTAGNTRIVGKRNVTDNEESFKVDGCVGHSPAFFSPWRIRLCEFGQGMWDVMSDIVCIGDGTNGYVYCAPKGKRELDIQKIKDTYINLGKKNNVIGVYPPEFDFIFASGDEPVNGKYYDACYFPSSKYTFTTNKHNNIANSNKSWGDFYWNIQDNNTAYEFLCGGCVTDGPRCGLCFVNSYNVLGLSFWPLASRD